MFRTSRIGRFINQNLFNIILFSIVIAIIIIIVQFMNHLEKNKLQNNTINTESNSDVEDVYTPHRICGILPE